MTDIALAIANDIEQAFSKWQGWYDPDRTDATRRTFFSEMLDDNVPTVVRSLDDEGNGWEYQEGDDDAIVLIAGESVSCYRSGP